jgi:hypothetical protein
LQQAKSFSYKLRPVVLIIGSCLAGFISKVMKSIAINS